MEISHETRLAPPGGAVLRNGCGLGAAAGNSTSPPGRNHHNRSNYFPRRHKPETSLYDEVMGTFDKSFVYLKPKDGIWSLPSEDNGRGLFSEYYQFDSLQELKIKLNEVKSQLNDYPIIEWSAHTRRKNPAGEIPWRLKTDIKAEFVTIAWCKLFECLNKCPEMVKGPQLNSLHLCEAPGAFITALNHYLFTRYSENEVQWKWLATTLNPYYEGNPMDKMIPDDRFILYTLENWLFHKDFTGNIISKANLEHMKQQCEQRLGEVHLITADGSIDCVDAPDCQEETVDLLHFAEIVTALEILADGGSFVVKMFTLFEATSVCKLFLLNCVFQEVQVFKPCTSKRGNSEVYVICLNYQKNNAALQSILPKLREQLNGGKVLMPLFAKASLPREFLLQHEIMCRLFMSYQSKAIESNIQSFEIKPTKVRIKNLQTLRALVCDEYFRRYKVRKLPENLKILYKSNAAIDKGYKVQIYNGSYSEREMLKCITVEEQIFQLRKQLNDLEKCFADAWDSSDHELKPSGDGNRPLPITIYNGQPIATLKSSLFTHIHMLVMREKLNGIYATDVLWYGDPQVVFPRECYSLKYNEFHGPNFSEQQEKFFKLLLENLLKHQPSVVKFQNMPILSHYAASIIRYLSLGVYKSLEFSYHPVFEITLAEPCDNFASLTEHLYKALCCSCSGDILCFVNILELHYNNFNKSLKHYNNTLLLENYKSILGN